LISEGGGALPSNIRAFDARSAPRVTAGEFVTPNTDKVKGKQYIAIVAGGPRYNLKSESK
jgi:hypothetical protein